MKLRRKKQDTPEQVPTALTFGRTPEGTVLCEVRDQHDVPMFDIELERDAVRATRDALSRCLKVM